MEAVAENGKEDLKEKCKRKIPAALPCRRLSHITASTPEDRAAREITRCLHESNFYAIHSAIKSLGVTKAIELFNETSKIQKEGGILAFDGERKKSPGGVFLGLVKKTVTDEQRKVIFKRIRGRRKRTLTIKTNSNGVISEDCGTNEEQMETDELPSSVSGGPLITKVEEKDRVKGDQFDDLPDPGDYGLTFC